MAGLVEDIAAAISGRAALPPLDQSLDLAAGYDLRAQVYEQLSGQSPGGIKAGVTSAGLQKAFGIDHALLGRLYPDGRLASGGRFESLLGKVIECEIGLIIHGGQITGVCPALEFARLGFARPADASAAYLTAGNVAADQYMTADVHPWDATLEQETLRLYRDGHLVNEAPVSESLGGCAAAAAWMLAEADRRDIEVPESCLFMTGACGEVLPAEPGDYEADYGRLGRLTFRVTA